MKPAPKSPAMGKAIDDLTKTLFGDRPRRATIEADLCVTCGGPAKDFKDTLSLKEYSISGMCQTCQDSVFG